MDIKYRVLGLDKTSLCITVNYYTDEVPMGLTYNLDLPLEGNPEGEKLKSFILFNAPKVQLERIAQVKKAKINTKELESMIELGIENQFQMPLDELKRLSRQMLEEKLEKELHNGVLYRGHRFDSGRNSFSILSSVVAGLGAGSKLPENYFWRSTGNNNVLMNAAELVELHRLMIEHTHNTYQIFWGKKNQVEMAQNKEELNNVKWVILGDMYA